MSRKRRQSCTLEISDYDDSFLEDKNEMMKLTKIAKSWAFTCSFCFKKFPSAQALGGHQNAHRTERLEEKRLFVSDPIGYRKRAYLRATKIDESSDAEGGSDLSLGAHATSNMVKHGLIDLNYPQIIPKPVLLLGEYHESNALTCGNIDFCGRSSGSGEIVKKLPFVLRNFFPSKELSQAETVGVHAEDVKDQAHVEMHVGQYGKNLEKVDLTLRL